MTEQDIYKWTFRSHRTFFSTFGKYEKNEGTNQIANLREHTNAKVSTAYYGGNGVWCGVLQSSEAGYGGEERGPATLVPDFRFTNLSLLDSMKSPSKSFL